jgi:hypothetical protein
VKWVWGYEYYLGIDNFLGRRDRYEHQSAKARQHKIPGLCLNFALVTPQKSGEFKTQKTFVNLSALQS